MINGRGQDNRKGQNCCSDIDGWLDVLACMLLAGGSAGKLSTVLMLGLWERRFVLLSPQILHGMDIPRVPRPRNPAHAPQRRGLGVLNLGERLVVAPRVL